MATEIEELQLLNETLLEFVNYEKAQDVLAAAALVEEKKAVLLEEEAYATHLAASEKAESDYRTSVLLAISELETGDAAPVIATDYTNLLTNIETALVPDADRYEVEYYSDLSLIVLVGGLIPVWIAVKLIKWIFQMLERAF